ncbi:hypothetical protein [Acinetobacter calcoaceticus]|uniref:hypothetical protein n=1 Tax=Acinetobacter calcoaceticus TaxID=471 RepID=UPI001AEA2526|nr:hypothetical protein [Acinetobacter calcoaceticus]MBP2603661.1 hypothetical protein [Acinetobacter calcoaceticus]
MSQDKLGEIQKIISEIIQLTKDIETKSEHLTLLRNSDPYEPTYTLYDLQRNLAADSLATPTYIELYTNEDYDKQIKILAEFKTQIEAIKNNVFQEKETAVHFGELIRYLFNFTQYYYNITLTDEKKKKEYLLKLYNYIKNKNSSFDDHETIKNYIEKEDYDEPILLKFFGIFKNTINGTKEHRDKLERDILDLINDKRTQLLNEEVEELTELSKEVREKIGLIEDQKLIFAHQNFSKNQDSPVCKLSWAINCIFIFIIGSLIALFCYFTISKIELNWRYYIFYLSIYITLTGYLTYLIKERVRLLNIKSYCDKTWLEITALSYYMAEFKPDEVVKLKMQLADKYFAGPNIESSNIKELSPELTTSLIMELLKSGKDQASK